MVKGPTRSCPSNYHWSWKNSYPGTQPRTSSSLSFIYACSQG